MGPPPPQDPFPQVLPLADRGRALQVPEWFLQPPPLPSLGAERVQTSAAPWPLATPFLAVQLLRSHSHLAPSPPHPPPPPVPLPWLAPPANLWKIPYTRIPPPGPCFSDPNPSTPPPRPVCSLFSCLTRCPHPTLPEGTSSSPDNRRVLLPPARHPCLGSSSDKSLTLQISA